MAATTFGVTVADVTRSCPFDTRSISATTEVSTGDLEAWIALAGGRFRSALAKVGLSADNLSDDDLAVVREGIVQYSVARAVQALGMGSAQYDAAWSAYTDRLDAIESRPSTLTAGTARTPGSNLDRYNPATRRAAFGRDNRW